MLSVKIGDQVLDAEKIRLRLERTRPGSFSFVLPENYDVDLEDQVKIYRNNSHVFTGIVERIVKRHDPEIGVEVHVSGRDLSAKLARRVIYDEILEGEPRDLVRAMCMPHLKLHNRYGIHAFDSDLYENWRYGYYIAYEGSYLADTWDFYRDQFYRYRVTRGGGIDKKFINYSKKIAPITGDVWLSTIFWARVGHITWNDVIHDLRYGLLVRYIDDDNYLAAVLRTRWEWRDYPPEQPTTHYYYYINHIQLLQCLNGNLSTLATLVILEDWYPDDSHEYRNWFNRNWIHLVARIKSNKIKMWVKALRRISQGYDGSHELSATFDPSLTQGRVGLYVWEDDAASYSVDMDNYFLFRYLQASKNPVEDLDASLYGDEAGLAGALTRRLLWESKTSQAAGQWFKLDLGELKYVSRVKIVQDLENYARNWKLEVSPDDSNWTQVASRSNDYSPIIDATFTSQYIRYIKITITASDSHRWGIAEAWAYFSDGDWLLACSDENMDAYGEPIALRVDSATALEALYKIVDTCGWLFWVDKDGNAHFKARRGTDKSGNVKFGGDGVEIIAAHRDVDLRKASSRLHYEGHGSTPPDERRLFVDVRDASSEQTYGVLAKRMSGKDLIRLLALNKRASAELDKGKPSQTEWRLD